MWLFLSSFFTFCNFICKVISIHNIPYFSRLWIVFRPYIQFHCYMRIFSFLHRCHKEDFFALIRRIVLICADVATFMHVIVACSVLVAVNVNMTPHGLEISSNAPIKIKPISLSSYLWMLHNYIWMETTLEIQKISCKCFFL